MSRMTTNDNIHIVSKLIKYLHLTERSPDMLAPAKIPVAAGKKMEKTEKNVSPRKSGPRFSNMIEPGKKR